MQQFVRSQKPGGGTQVQTVMITAITLFALSGAILGFAVGAFTRPHSTAPTTNTSNNNKKQTPVVVAKTPSPTTTTVAAQPIPQGCPRIVTTYSLDGTITLNLIAKQKTPGSNCDPDKEADLTSNGITCRIFLAKADGDHPLLDGSDETLFKDTTKYSSSFPHELTGLSVVNGGSLTQPCVQGKATWTLKLADTLAKGKYYIVGVTGNSPFYNFSWSGQLSTENK